MKPYSKDGWLFSWEEDAAKVKVVENNLCPNQPFFAPFFAALFPSEVLVKVDFQISGKLFYKSSVRQKTFQKKIFILLQPKNIVKLFESCLFT